ncbi:LysM peptidoglycan-binding domain-containing protein [Aspergillus lucknowensis]|uniref:LysM domain-containing protein n=1 Tax=Aspergillus lucknowensis TaxID=176173 RepID=A0ABR4LSK4_9EURO
MLTVPLILAAGSLSTLVVGAPVLSSPLSVRHSHSHHLVHSHSLAKRTYNVLGGAGKVAEGWPSLDHWWPDFDEMFEANRDTMKQSCTQWNVPNNSDQEIDDISSAIKSVSSSSGVDPRFILAIVIQESNGCVRAPTTDNGVINPGLMQSHNGVGSCNNGQVLTPCPADQITQMIKDGTEGTADGAGLLGCLEEAGGLGDVSSYYRAARIYNSGSIAPSGNLGDGIATHCYSSDVANRLSGWSTGPSSCDSNIIGTLKTAVTSNFLFNGVSSALGSSDEPDQTDETDQTDQTETDNTPPAPATAEAPEPTTTSTTTEAAHTADSAPTTTSDPEPPAPTSPVPLYPSANPACKKYYTVEAGDYCLKVESEIGVSVAQLRELNPGLKEDCTNLWLGYQYCIEA